MTASHDLGEKLLHKGKMTAQMVWLFSRSIFRASQSGAIIEKPLQDL